MTHHIIIADTYKYYLRGIAEILSEHKFEAVNTIAVVEACDLVLDNSFLQQARLVPPIIYIIGPNLAEVLAFKLCRVIRTQPHKLKIILISADADDLLYQVDACGVGVCTCLLRHVTDDELCQTIVNVAAGYLHISEQALTLAQIPIKLSNAEWVVLTHLAQGLSDIEISEKMGNKPNTVGVHIGNIFSKLGVHSREKAVLRAQRRGLFDT